jgi:signal transduction histidine kinase
MFGKLEASASINKTGIGLGLSICKKIVQAMDGDIYLEDSTENVGSSFTFTVKVKVE